MGSVPLMWTFDDGLNGWAQSTDMEMGIEVDAIDGSLRGVVLPSAHGPGAFVDSPELRVQIDGSARDFLILRMKFFGSCNRAVLSLERNSKETAVDPGIRRERTTFHDRVDIPFQPQQNALNDDLYYFPIWQYVTGTIHRVRLYPCTKAIKPGAPPSGQTFHIDWVAFAKDVVHIEPELELECTLPPASATWVASPTVPSVVKVQNGRLHGLADDAPFLSYRIGVSALTAPVISNVAAHALDLNWSPSSDIWETMTITGYLIEWKKCSATTFETMVVGNVTSTTVINLASGTAYHARITALTEDYLQRDAWRSLDLYGRRSMLSRAIIMDILMELTHAFNE
ncbi:hypothetical protein ATCC90586_009876 [Pythium insidiosum]|nr:hypothetical protein ATCC90586_009876 [Pythium insidiosum]